MLATNFGNLCQTVTKIDSQNFGYQIWFCTRLLMLKPIPWRWHQLSYQIIYTWRIIEGHVSNFDCTPIQSYKNSRHGWECRVPPISSSAPCAIQTIRFSTLPVKGPRLFNVLPKNLWNMSGCTTERFKCELDCYLATVPDEPLVPGLTQYRRCDSNSVIDWANSPYLHQQDNQLQQHNYLELEEAVTMWRPLGYHKHYWVSDTKPLSFIPGQCLSK